MKVEPMQKGHEGWASLECVPEKWCSYGISQLSVVVCCFSAQTLWSGSALTDSFLKIQ